MRAGLWAWEASFSFLSVSSLGRGDRVVSASFRGEVSSLITGVRVEERALWTSPGTGVLIF